jgi:hypothetical protein
VRTEDLNVSIIDFDTDTLDFELVITDVVDGVEVFRTDRVTSPVIGLKVEGN